MGALLFNGNCITCHHETLSISAPSIREIVIHYKTAFPLKEDFVHYMSVWVKKPKEETSIMLDAVNTYELMPDLSYEISTLEEIASFLYDKDFQ